jgi:putative component of toxin-antitoxin plasmid stabilization module
MIKWRLLPTDMIMGPRECGVLLKHTGRAYRAYVIEHNDTSMLFLCTVDFSAHVSVMLSAGLHY